MYISDTLEKRGVPSLLEFSDGRKVTSDNADERRAEIREILQREIYGKMPPKPDFVRGEIIEKPKSRDCAGKAQIKKILLTVSVVGNEYSFPIWLVMPKNIARPRFVVFLNFRPNLPDEYLPCEELIDRGIGFAAVCYKDVTSDDGDFSNGIADALAKCGYTDTGKLAMWGYTASRILDYVLENEEIDTDHIAVAGHSRLGKTALVAACFDERFTCAYSNDSGCSGAAITRGKAGETVEFITKTFPFWFCKKYREYSGRHDALPFDQHYLIASIAPRKVYVASAVEDEWADPESEYLSLCAASDFWSLYGKGTFTPVERAPIVGDVIQGESLGYHLRSGVHFLSREDWNKFIDFFLK